MGPCSDEHGNDLTASFVRALLELQWGRALMSTEITL